MLEVDITVMDIRQATITVQDTAITVADMEGVIAAVRVDTIGINTMLTCRIAQLQYQSAVKFNQCR